MLKKIRQYFLEVKEGFLDAKAETSLPAIELTYWSFVYTIYLILSLFTAILDEVFNLKLYAFIIIAILSIALFIFSFYHKASFWASRFSTTLLFKLFGRYGRVVTKEDWKMIKKKCPKVYKELFSKKSNRHCYYYSWRVALFLKDAQLMYGSFRGDNYGSLSGHAVVVKNNCVYDTNYRLHFDIDEYKQFTDFTVYKMFSEKEYHTKDFFDNIREGFQQWCVEHNAYCNPQWNYYPQKS